MQTNRFPSILLNSLLLSILLPASGGCSASPTPDAAPPPTAIAAAPSPAVEHDPVPYELVSEESLFTYLEALTSIQPYSGWRNSGSLGEAEALDYVETVLNGFAGLNAGGLDLERQAFPVYLSTEIWDAGLVLTVDGVQARVPAEALRGSRFVRQNAVYFDTDGVVSDSDRNPVTASGPALLVRTEDELYSLTREQVNGRILVLDFALIDRITNTFSGDGRRMGAVENTSQVMRLVDQGLAGVLLVTRFSNRSDESHGTTISEAANFAWGVPARRIPFLFTRIEDLGPAGITDWEDVARIASAELTLDVDVLSPGTSGNLIARIPGADPSKAVILGAHIDSPNTPGALDDGSGSAALLEIARVLDASRSQPPVDVYLAWFGSEELGLYGSSYFASTHQELLDRTLAMLQMDGLGLTLDGRTSSITAVLTPFDRFGDDRLPLPGYLAAILAERQVALDVYTEYGLASDHNSFEAFGVPNLDLMYVNATDMRYAAHPIHYYTHWHEPYETADRVRPAGPVFVDMTRTLLGAALEIGYHRPDLQVAPAPTRRALIVASHTDAFLGLTVLRELGMALSLAGFDVDLVPYGQAISPADLQGVDLVILPPALNSPGSAVETWTGDEIAGLTGYVAGGGLLLVVNSSRDYASTIYFPTRNINARSDNPLLEPMGIRFRLGGTGSGNTAYAAADHPLTANAAYLALDGENAVAFRMDDGVVLFEADSTYPLVGLVDYGERGGQVLVVAEWSLLGSNEPGGRNIEFLQNIAEYAGQR